MKPINNQNCFDFFITFFTYTFSRVFLPKIPDGLKMSIKIKMTNAAASLQSEKPSALTNVSTTPSTSLRP